MLLVQTFIAESYIEGLGLFAGQDIPAGTKVWRFVSGFDMSWSEEAWDELPEQAQIYIRHYGYLDKISQQWCLDADGMRYENHEENNPNLIDDRDGNIVAARDIAKGEELTADYRLFDLDWQAKLAALYVK